IGPLPRPIDVHRKILVVEIGMVENVERLQAKLDVDPLVDGDVLEQRHIPVLQSSCADDVASGAGLWSNRRDNQISLLIDRIIVGIRTPHIRTSQGSRIEGKAVVQVGRWCSSHRVDDTAELIVVGNIGQPFRTTEVPGQSRDVVYVARRKYMVAVPIGRSIVDKRVKWVLKVLVAGGGCQAL